MESRLFFIVLLSAIATLSHCARIRPILMQCYNETAIPGITTANGRSPSTLNVFLELIRRLEDANPNLSARDLSALIKQRLRQDGIDNSQNVQGGSSLTIPFGVLRPESFKTTLILTKYLQNSTSTLNFGDLQPRDICTLHYMISSTIHTRVRGDEGRTCTRSARYTARLKREIEESGTETTPFDDVETVAFFEAKSSSTGSTGSQCPLELGVFLTNYGTIKGGQVLAGIATGFNQQTVGNVNNIYAATLAGEIVEAALSQGQTNIQIGVPGGWNSTITPRYYFLEKNTGLQLTDAEIRGSLDGLYMASKVSAWTASYDIKISQIIDMYYSPHQKGVFDANFQPCRRNLLYNDVTSTEIMRTQILNFMDPLDDAARYGFTYDPLEFENLTRLAYESFMNYLPQMTNKDLACTSLERIERVASDLLIFVDSGWNYNTIQSTISNVLDSVDVNKFETRYSIFSGLTGANMTNRTSYLTDFYNQFNLSSYQTHAPGFDYIRVFDIVEGLFREKLNNNTYTGGDSTVVLLIPRSLPNDAQRSNLEQRRNSIRRFLPNLNVIVLGTGTQSDFNSIVLNQDFISMVDTTNENEIRRNVAERVVARIKNANRAIVNPSCGATFTGSSRTFSLTEYVEVRGVNYYTIQPHYFHTGDGSRLLKITENSSGNIRVCLSRNQAKPSNTSDTCQLLKSNVHTVDISGYCGESMQDCSPIYLAVDGISSTARCTEVRCRFPDNIKYTISLENVGCTSSSMKIVASFVSIVTIFILTLL